MKDPIKILFHLKKKMKLEDLLKIKIKKETNEKSIQNKILVLNYKKISDNLYIDLILILSNKYLIKTILILI